MKKIPTLFRRDESNRQYVIDEVSPEARWVFDGEGVATQKHDGTACLVEEGVLYKRYTLRRGKTAPSGFRAATDVDPKTGKQEGWVLVGDGSEDQHHREAFERDAPMADGTYELCGPKVQGNPERLDKHVLIWHGIVKLPDAPRWFNELSAYFRTHDVEGIVWHHPDGRMAKIKARDFGVSRDMPHKDP